MHAEHRLSRRDRLVSTVEAGRTIFSSGPRTTLVTATEGIGRKITPRTDVELHVGAAAAWFKPDSDAKKTLTPYPVATGIMNHRHLLAHDASLGIDVTASIGPTIHRITGLVAQRVQATAGVSLTDKDLLTRLEGGAVQMLPRDDPQAFRIFYGHANVAYKLGRLVVVDTGVRYVWQQQPAIGQLPSQKVVYVGLTIREPTLQF
jgi:hypothetical protein